MSELAKRLGVQSQEKINTELPNDPAKEPNGDDVGGSDTDKNEPQPGADIPAPEPVIDNEADEDAKLLERLNKRGGTNFQTLDELYAAINKPAEPAVDEATAKKKKATEVLKFGLEAELVTTDDYNKFQVDQAKTPRQLVYEEFAAKHSDKSESQINRMFAKKYGEDLAAEEDDSEETKSEIETVKQERAEDLKKDFNRILKKKYGHVLSLEQKYDDHIASKNAEKVRATQLAANKEQYLADLNSIISTTTHRPIRFGDEAKPETIFEDTFQYPKEVLDQVKSEFLQPDQVNRLIEKHDKALLQTMIDLRLKELTLDSIIEHTAKKYYSKKVEQKKNARKNLADETGGVSGDTQDTKARNGILAQRLRQGGYVSEEV